MPGASSTSKPARVTASSKKKTRKATPRTGPRKGRKGKLDGMEQAAVSTPNPNPEVGKGCLEESGEDM